MLHFTFKKEFPKNGISSQIEIMKHPKIDQKLKDVFIRHFNEHDYKNNKVNMFKKICSNNNYQLITDFNFNYNNNINKINNGYVFLIFDYKKLLSLVDSLQTLLMIKNDDIIERSAFYIICNIDEIFDVLFENTMYVLELLASPYELFNKKVMIKCDFCANLGGYYIEKEQFISFESYNYIYYHAYELLMKLLKKYPSSKIFDIIFNQETPEAKELYTLLNIFNK